MEPATKKNLPGHSKEKIGKKTSLDALIMNNLEILLDITVDKSRGNTCGSVV